MKNLLITLPIIFCVNIFANDNESWEAKWISVSVKGEKLECKNGENLIEFSKNVPVDGGYSGNGDITTIYCIQNDKQNKNSWTVQTYSNKPNHADISLKCSIEETQIDGLDGIMHCDKHSIVKISDIEFEIDKNSIIYTNSTDSIETKIN